MASNIHEAVVLLPAVEEAISRICCEQNQPPLCEQTRRDLARSGKEKSLKVLEKIRGMRIGYSFDGIIIHLLRNYYEPDSSVSSPQKRPLPSSSSSSQLNSSPFSSPVKTCRLMMSPKGRDDVVAGTPPNPPPLSSNLAGEDRYSPELIALGELEFRKAFLILSYIGKERVEKVTTAEKIRELKDLAMDKLEEEVWFSLGRHYVDPADRCKSLGWETGKTYLYHCHVSENGSCEFKGPYLDKSRNHLQRVLGDENVLIVKFVTDSKSSAHNGCYAKYRKILKDGILVGLRQYQFFVFKDKDGGKKAKKKDSTSSSVKCIFVRFESNASIDDGKEYPLTGKTIQDARCLFMHVHTVTTVAKYMARFSLILSGTMKLDVDLADINVKWIDDEPCRDKHGKSVINKDGEPCIHTDGTGFISEDLALRCPHNVFKGSVGNGDHFEGKFSDMKSTEAHCRVPPLIIQVRLFHNGSAVKGTLLVNKKLPPRTIEVRHTMIKVYPDKEMPNVCTRNSLEIVTTSNKPKRAYLSKYLIALLSYGGVPDDIFMDILKNALEESQDVFSNKRVAVKVSLIYGGMDEFAAAKMILSGIPLDETYLRHRLSIMFNEERKSLLALKVPLTDSYNLMGTVDPSGVLESDEVSIILDNGQISGKVLVYRHPGLHFGDVHVLNARYVEALNEYVGNAKYAIFFPCKGPRSLADEMAGGDFDGDTFFVSRNPQLLDYFKVSEPWIESPSTCGVSGKGLSELSKQELEDELFELLLRATFQPSKAKGIAADNWMAIMDRFLTLEDSNSSEKEYTKENLLRLVNLYYEALDASKTGKKVEIPQDLMPNVYPHYMEHYNSFKSTSILGRMYDFVKAYGEEQSRRKGEVRKLPFFDIGFSEDSGRKWTALYEQYKRDMKTAMESKNKEHRVATTNEVYDKYKQELFEAAEFEESKKKDDQIFDEALAIYNICYDYAIRIKDVGKCGFAWKVAGSALLELYTKKQGVRTVRCSPIVLKELFT